MTARSLDPWIERDSVFLNIPYDNAFRHLYLAYIVGLVHLDFTPRATLSISGGTRRLDKILQEIQECSYSVHDLSRVQLDRTKPQTPRFSMPFELGLAVSWAQLNPSRHTWFVFEESPYRIRHGRRPAWLVQCICPPTTPADGGEHDGNVSPDLRQADGDSQRGQCAKPLRSKSFPEHMLRSQERRRPAPPKLKSSRRRACTPMQVRRPLLNQRQTYIFRLAGGTMLFMRRYTTIWP
jgi:hypothetical protein